MFSNNNLEFLQVSTWLFNSVHHPKAPASLIKTHPEVNVKETGAFSVCALALMRCLCYTRQPSRRVSPLPRVS